nr:putative holin-like toxin [Bacillus paralicheniformis]
MHMTTFETISLMIAFGMLIAVLSKKKIDLP